jgi:hypothetical protein
MAVANVAPSHDHSRFELHSRVSSAVPKIIAKSAHRGEIARWVQAIKLNIDYYSKNPPDRQPKRSPSLNAIVERPIVSTLNAMPPPDAFLSPTLQRSTTGLTGASITQPVAESYRHREASPAHAPGTETIDDGAETISIFEAADDRSLVDTVEGATASGIPHQTTFDLAVINIKAQLELAEQLVQSIVTPPGTPGSYTESHGMARTPSRQQAVKDALRSSLATLAALVSQQHLMTQDRERYLLSRISREVDARRLWEENMLTVAQQQADMDRQLTEAAQHNEKKRKALRQAKEVLAGISAAGSLPVSPMADDASAISTPDARGILDVPPSAVSGTSGTVPSFRTVPTHRQSISISNVQEVHAALQDAESEDEDDDDEFFDAIEQGALPNLKLHESIAYPENVRPGTPTAVNEAKAFELEAKRPEKGTIKEYLARKSLEPYFHVRSKLPIDDDKRPSVSCECRSVIRVSPADTVDKCGAS